MRNDLEKNAKTLQPAPFAGKRVVRPGRKRPITPTRRVEPSTPLRLVGGAAAPDVRPPIQNPTPIQGATDPRWVLAIRTAQLLEGDVLPPAKREALMRTGKVMGLTPFDCSLILAVVQDRARRGIAPEYCPAAGESQLALIPLPQVRPMFSAFTTNPLQVALLAAGMIALQALLMWVWLS